MTTDGGDLTFPACCVYCPHLDSSGASCTHDLRQSLVLELDDDRTCPVYAAEKTEAMRRSAESLSSVEVEAEREEGEADDDQP